jgi:trimethylamine--corrinoid protein Co-methyltransferase
MNAASTQMSHFYGLPIYNTCGITDSKIPDIQAGFEMGLTTAVTALAGANYNHHAAGMRESLLAVAYEQYVIDDDIGGQVMRLVRGLEVTEETLSLDVIHDVANGENHYLGQPQTIELMNTEYHYPHTADRATRADWEAGGSLDMREKARRQARQTLQSFFPEVVVEEVDRRLRDEFNILLPRQVMAAGGYP